MRRFDLSMCSSSLAFKFHVLDRPMQIMHPALKVTPSIELELFLTKEAESKLFTWQPSIDSLSNNLNRKKKQIENTLL